MTFRFRATFAGIGFGLIGLEPCPDVRAHVDVGNVDGHDFECGLRIEASGQHRFGDSVGILQNFLVRVGRADGRDDTFAHACDHGFLGGTADQLLQVRSHGHTRPNTQLDTVFGDSA